MPGPLASGSAHSDSRPVTRSVSPVRVAKFVGVARVGPPIAARFPYQRQATAGPSVEHAATPQPMTAAS